MHFDQTVVNQNTAAVVNIHRELFIRNRDAAFGSRDVARRQGKAVALMQDSLPLFKKTDADLRPFGVKQNTNRKRKLAPKPVYLLKALSVLLMRRVGKVEACDVHARKHQLPDNLIRRGGRPQRADNLCFSHGKNLPCIRGKTNLTACTYPVGISPAGLILSYHLYFYFTRFFVQDKDLFL